MHFLFLPKMVTLVTNQNVTHKSIPNQTTIYQRIGNVSTKKTLTYTVFFLKKKRQIYLIFQLLPESSRLEKHYSEKIELSSEFFSGQNNFQKI